MKTILKSQKYKDLVRIELSRARVSQEVKLCIGVAQYTDIKLIKMSDNEMPGDWTSGLLDCLISKLSKVTISFKDFSFISKSYAKNDLETDLVPRKRPL